MLTVDHYARIRQSRRDGLTIRAIADQLHHSPKTILKALAHPEPVPAVPVAPRAAPVFGPFREIVEGILAADELAPRKQRHTAMQVFRRLVSEHAYSGGYDQIRRYLQARRLSQRETFIPLTHPPGRRAEADFGHIYADFPDGRRQVPVLIVTWSYSNAPFALALPTERTEAILHGLVEAFAFFGCVPGELWWDNPRTVAVQLFRGRERTLHPRYAALASHYQFTPKFCLPATATEKPRVENRVYDLQRQWATPVPQVGDFDALNAHLRRCCLAARERPCGGHAEPVQVRFDHDRAAAVPVPERPFDACILQPGQVDKFQTVRFDRNAYSVPRRWAFRAVTVKGYVERVAVVANGDVVASHRRSYGRGEKVLDPLHYLTVLERKPAALDQAPVYRDWQLPPAFVSLRQALTERWGARSGTNQFIRVLQLLGRHPLSRVEEAIVASQTSDAPQVAAIVAAVERTASDLGPSPVVPASLAVLTVPPPDLSQFDRLLSRFPRGDDADEWRGNSAVAADPSETVEAAHDVGGVG
jgi:transposase